MKNPKFVLLFFILISLILFSAGAQQGEEPPEPDRDIGPVDETPAYQLLPKIYLSDKRVTLYPRKEADDIFGFTDGGALVARRTPTFRLVLPVCNRTVLFEGSDITHLRSTRTVLTHGPPGSIDNGYVGIHSGYIHEGLAEPAPVIGFYHSEDNEDLPSFPSGIPGFYGRVCGAVSYDQGLTWRKLGPLLESFKPKEYQFPGYSHPDRGLGICGAVIDKTGTYVYLYYNENSRVDENGKHRGVSICLARAALSDIEQWRMIVPKPDLFKKYYKGGFTQPGIGGYDTPVIDNYSINAYGYAEAIAPQPSYASEFGLYVMVFDIGWWKYPASDKSGVYMSFSEDGITWSIPTQIIKVPGQGPVYLSYPTIVWDQSDGTSDPKTGWLMYSYHPDNVNLRYMAGQRIALSHHPLAGPAVQDFIKYRTIDPGAL
jgi:hypothetical protein